MPFFGRNRTLQQTQCVRARVCVCVCARVCVCYKRNTSSVNSHWWHTPLHFTGHGAQRTAFQSSVFEVKGKDFKVVLLHAARVASPCSTPYGQQKIHRHTYTHKRAHTERRPPLHTRPQTVNLQLSRGEQPQVTADTEVMPHV